MAKWKIVSGARPFHKFPERPDAVLGWARDYERAGVQRTVNLCVSREADEASELPDECRLAIRTHGRTIFNALVDEDEPPRIIDVTLTGLEYEYGGWPVDEIEDEEEEDDDLDEDWDGDEDEDEDEEGSGDEDDSRDPSTATA